MIAVIADELNKISARKGISLGEITAETVLLGGDLAIDSLDLATLLIALEQRLGRDPFRDGIRDFQTAGELANLFAA